MADQKSPTEQLGELLREAGMRVYFDPGNNNTHHCTFCGTRPCPTHDLVRIGSYPNGDPISRPVCSQCAPIVKATDAAAPPVALPTNICPDCHLLKCPSGLPWDLGLHCPKTMRLGDDVTTRTLAERDCLRIGIERPRVQGIRAIQILKKAAAALDDAATLLASEGADRD